MKLVFVSSNILFTVDSGALNLEARNTCLKVLRIIVLSTISKRLSHYLESNAEPSQLINLTS
jgi:hypothetical protein